MSTQIASKASPAKSRDSPKSMYCPRNVCSTQDPVTKDSYSVPNSYIEEDSFFNKKIPLYELFFVTMVSIMSSIELPIIGLSWWSSFILYSGFACYFLYKYRETFKNMDVISIGVSILLYCMASYYIFKMVGAITIFYGACIVVSFINKTLLISNLKKCIDNCHKNKQVHELVIKISKYYNTIMTKYVTTTNNIKNSVTYHAVINTCNYCINNTFGFIMFTINLIDISTKNTKFEFVIDGIKTFLIKFDTLNQMLNNGIDMLFMIPLITGFINNNNNNTPNENSDEMLHQSTYEPNNENSNDDFDISSMIGMFLQTMNSSQIVNQPSRSNNNETKKNKSKKLKKKSNVNLDNVTDEDTECLDNLMNKCDNKKTD